MPAREVITDSDVCFLARKWRVGLDTMERVWSSAQDFLQELGRPVWIISGWRSPQEQRELGRRGRPTAPPNLSTHLSCPATGVDISFGHFASTFEKSVWGQIVMRNGLRWGGGSELDDNGLPTDWQHVDRGPRR